MPKKSSSHKLNRYAVTVQVEAGSKEEAKRMVEGKRSNPGHFMNDKLVDMAVRKEWITASQVPEIYRIAEAIAQLDGYDLSHSAGYVGEALQYKGLEGLKKVAQGYEWGGIGRGWVAYSHPYLPNTMRNRAQVILQAMGNVEGRENP